MTSRALEKGVAIPLPGESIALEGIFLAGPRPDSGGAVVAPPHPLMGGSMEHPVVAEIAFAAQDAELASLRFNWRGVGASGGESSGAAEAAEADYAAAASHLGQTVPGPLVAAGYSFGALAAVRVAGASPRLQRLLLVAPPVAMLGSAGLERARGRVLIVSGELDEYAPPDALEELAARLPEVRVVCVPEADHFFNRGLAGVGRAVRAWL